MHSRLLIEDSVGNECQCSMYLSLTTSCSHVMPYPYSDVYKNIVQSDFPKLKWISRISSFGKKLIAGEKVDDDHAMQ